MPADFFDTNILVYFALEDSRKAEKAKSLITRGGTISVQVLNEFANVVRNKRKRSWKEARSLLDTLQAVFDVVPVTIETHELGLALSERHQLAIYDAMIVAAALLAGCETLWSEDMHDGLVIGGQTTIRNPFVDPER